MEYHRHITPSSNSNQHIFGNRMCDYKILNELGRGSYGVVYRVQSLKVIENQKTYVLKKITLTHLKPKLQQAAFKEV